MSEFQGYAFRAVDRALTRLEMEELEWLSTRAEVTPRGMSVFYNGGDLRGRPEELMKKYFDIFVYTANWGTNRVIFRIPAGLLDREAAGAYEAGGSLSLTDTDESLLLDFTAHQEGGVGW